MTGLQEIFADIANKDHQAFETLYKNTSPKLYALCLHILNYDKETAEEVLQETYIKIWNKVDKYNYKKGSPLAWMSQVARNQAFDRLRSYKSRPHLTQELDYESIEYASSDLDHLEKKNQTDQIDLFKQKLRNLSKTKQQVITRSVIYGYSHDEIANDLEIPLGSVK